MSIIVATWNIHSGVGVDRRFKPERIAAVIVELDADVIALQEVGARRAGFDMTAFLRQNGGYEVISQVTLRDRLGAFGNAVMTRLPVVSHALRDLSVARREPRGALEIIVATASGDLRIIATHLGLRADERREQIARLLAIVRADAQTPTIVAGDFNIWRAAAVALAPLDDRFGRARAPATFPAPWPGLPLDRIWIDPRCAPSASSIRTHTSRTARIASDHLPLLAVLG